MKKIIVNVPEDLHEALQARKAETDVPVSVFIRRAIVQALQLPISRTNNGVPADLFPQAAQRLVSKNPVLIPIQKMEAE